MGFVNFLFVVFCCNLDNGGVKTYISLHGFAVDSFFRS